MYQVIQVIVHTTKRRWIVQNRRRLRIRQRPGVSLFAGPPLLHRLPKHLLHGRVSTPIQSFQSPCWGLCPAAVCTASTCTCLGWATRFWWRGREDHREAGRGV